MRQFGAENPVISMPYAENVPHTAPRVGEVISARPMSEFQKLVNKMTNYERNQWARAGYPGLRPEQIDKLMPYAQAAHRRLTGTYLVLGRTAP